MGFLHVMAGVRVSGLVQLLHFGMTSFLIPRNMRPNSKVLKRKTNRICFPKKLDDTVAKFVWGHLASFELPHLFVHHTRMGRKKLNTLTLNVLTVPIRISMATAKFSPPDAHHFPEFALGLLDINCC